MILLRNGITIDSGIIMFGRWSIGWNFHRDRTVRTFVLGAALSWAADRFMLSVGPVTFIFLYDMTEGRW